MRRELSGSSREASYWQEPYRPWESMQRQMLHFTYLHVIKACHCLQSSRSTRPTPCQYLPVDSSSWWCVLVVYCGFKGGEVAMLYTLPEGVVVNLPSLRPGVKYQPWSVSLKTS